MELPGRHRPPCYRLRLDLASAAMKTTHAFLCALLLGGSLFALEGCGSGTYRIPNVPPVVKQKPEEDILGDVDTSSSEPAKTDGDEEKPADKK